MSSKKGRREVLLDLQRVSLNDDGFYYCTVDVKPSRAASSSGHPKTDESRSFTKTPTFDRKTFNFQLPENFQEPRFDLTVSVYRAGREEPRRFVLYASQTVDCRFDSSTPTSLVEDGKTLRTRRRVFLTRNVTDTGMYKQIGKVEFDVTIREQDPRHEPKAMPSPVQSRVDSDAPQRNTRSVAESEMIPVDQESRGSTPGIDLPDPAGIPVLPSRVTRTDSRPRTRLEPSPSPTSGPPSSIRSIGNTAPQLGRIGAPLEPLPETPLSSAGDEDEVVSPIPDVTVKQSSPVERRFQPPSLSKHFPASDAMSLILPHYSSISQHQSEQLAANSSQKSDYKPLEIPAESPRPSPMSQTVENEPMDVRSMAVIERLTKELEDYRLGVQKMGSDIVQLRENIARLEQDKMFLKQEVADQDRASQSLVDQTELDLLDRVELIRRHVQLCQRFGAEAKRSRDYSQRIQKLQNEIIKKNDQEKGLLKTQQAHTAQQALVQKLQDRLQRSQRYKETCRQQEEVINRLEELIAKHVRDSALGKPTDTADVVDLLRKENSQLRASLVKFENVKSSPNGLKIDSLVPTMVKAPEVMILQQQLQEEKQRSGRLEQELEQTKMSQGLDGDRDKLDLEHKLQRTEARVKSLESTLTENAKSWAREKVSLEIQVTDLRARLAANKHSSHALTHSSLIQSIAPAPARDYATAIGIKSNPVYGGPLDYSGLIHEPPKAYQMQPVRHESTGAFRRPSPKLQPLSPSGQGGVT